MDLCVSAQRATNCIAGVETTMDSVVSDIRNSFHTHSHGFPSAFLLLKEKHGHNFLQLLDLDESAQSPQTALAIALVITMAVLLATRPTTTA
jgi:predicted ATPase